jgi:transposase
MRMYPEIAVEKAMKRQEIILRAFAKKISWIEAAEILGYSPRHLRRIREKYDEVGFDGLVDGRLGRESPRRIPVAILEQVLSLYREKYFDFSVAHFVEKLQEEHSMRVSYTWVKNLLQGAGLVAKDRPRKKHRKRRERKPIKGMMLHIDGSHHQWFGDERWHDLIVILDDADSEIYYAQLVEAESTATVMAALRQVVEKEGVFARPQPVMWSTSNRSLKSGGRWASFLSSSSHPTRRRREVAVREAFALGRDACRRS